ncbi:MAG: DMT family transporter [Pseudobdellovibrionaceae bacterium]
MKKDRAIWIGILQIFSAGVCFGFMGLAARQAYALGFEVGELLFFRFLLASMTLGTFLIIFCRSLLKVTKNELFICSLLGVCGYAVFATFYFTSIKGVSVPLAALLLYTFPAMVLVGAKFFLKEHITPLQWLALPTVCISLGLLLWGEIEVRSWGAVIAGLMSALMYSVYVLFSRRYQRQISALTSGFYVMLFAAVALYIVNHPQVSRVSDFTSSHWLVLAVIVGLCTIAPMVLFLAGLQKLKSSQAAFLSSVEPLTAAIVAAFFLNETLSWQQCLGGIGVIGAMVLSVWPSSPVEPQALS